MSKALSRMKPEERSAAIQRRLKQADGNRGLGYWAAVDAKEKKGSQK